ncbi:Nitrogen fixation protein FixH [Aliiroseovarius sediminilitoris]|uniref:Nitrogen fixation protein FixH n=1 Tax=Aliiroseovarius sediminilitoris TaxID=1173584 RepID=A0A1I0NKC7_9RHOB|nr:FixH family protein [Aliiroseovarius sediminilitoris]SEW01769.1 Nitrogen fixation protein FixH [Aliiroseovarius sediminilitoris]
MANPKDKKEFELTGKHVLAIVVSAFAVIIGVNLFMAYSAIDTFPGLETKNSYVASQKFDVQKAAQEALGWNVSAEMDGEVLVLDIKDRAGDAVTVKSVYGLLGRATHVKEDREPTFDQGSSGAYLAQVGKLGEGNWNLRLNVIAEDGTSFQRRIPIFVSAR